MLGKFGDLISILPCLQQEFKETGINPTLIVAKEYSTLPKSLPWLQVEEFDGSFENIHGAIKWAKQTGKIDYTPQMSGLNHKPERKHPSFQFDQWDRMGRLHQWRELTLELPRPTFDSRGCILNPDFYRKEKGQPLIILSDHSQSSPFAPIEDLHDSLVKEFSSHSIVRCSTARFPTLIGFLPLMDAADLIIAIDSAPLHLSRACKTPVIALVTDAPSLWHGSAHHPRFALHVRYSDFELRKSEILFTAKEILKLY